uniref:Uncharacterized protein n=1 Tax=Ananas comosus var. bracteatus TaxID=296719 RepID=A0A6V7PF30_ANACO|nr:unnamed protein product [Ananas comosus var. bracteatus]
MNPYDIGSSPPDPFSPFPFFPFLTPESAFSPTPSTQAEACTAGLASSRRPLTAGSASSRSLSTPARNPSPKSLHLYGSASLRPKPFTAGPKPFPEAPLPPDLPPPDPSPLRPETLPRSPFTYGSASLRSTPFTVGPKPFPEAPSPPDLPPPDLSPLRPETLPRSPFTYGSASLRPTPFTADLKPFPEAPSLPDLPLPDPSPLRPKPFTSGPKHFSDAPPLLDLPPPDAPPPWPNLYLWPEAPSPKPHHLRPEALSPPPESSHRRPNPSTARLLLRPKPILVPRAEIRISRRRGLDCVVSARSELSCWSSVNAIGAIDGTHIPVMVERRWEGSAADMRVLRWACERGSLPTSRHSGVGLCDAVRACGIEMPVGSRGTDSFQRGMMSYHGQLGGEAPVGSCGTDSFLAWNDGLPQAARRHKPDYTCVGPKIRLNNDIKLVAFHPGRGSGSRERNRLELASEEFDDRHMAGLDTHRAGLGRVPGRKYYLVDSGYANTEKFLAPYRG